MIDKTLGHYEIADELGRGGMGEVYRARDTKLGRDVAIKVLPAEFARDHERLARLEREARMLAALNHPNIAAIHGLEESDGSRFLVLELVKGDTLSERLERGALGVEESLKLALQIAEALGAAHEKGVIHRDLKPANIKITPEGRVKVLDFGLAKAFAPPEGDPGLSNSPTLSMQATQQGVVLGTAAYMSPEQARGETVDAATDIWAFGCVLFEMLSGRRTWTGRTVTDIIAGIVAREPDWKALPPSLPARVKFLLERCLEKEQADRCSRISEVVAELERAIADPSAPVESPSAPAHGARTIVPWVAAAVLSLLTGFAVWWMVPRPEAEVTRFTVEIPGGPLVAEAQGAIALSPDGRRLVFQANGQLYQRLMDQMDPTPIPGTEGGAWPFFSPGGEALAFFSNNRLLRVAPTGGAPVGLATLEGGVGLVGDWDEAGRIFFGQGGSVGLSVLPDTGGQPSPFAELGDASDLDYPDVLPGGEWVLFTENVNGATWDTANIVAQRIDGGDRKLLLSGGHFARYVPTGHLVYALNGSLYAVPFDAGRVEVTGTPVEVVEGVAMSSAGGGAAYALSGNGTLAYITGSAFGSLAPDRDMSLVWVDRDGGEETIPVRPDNYSFARISPDGTRVALVVGSALPATDPPPDIWILDLETGNLRQLTFDEASDDGPLWSPDSSQIYFRSWRSGTPAIYSVPAEGGEAEPVEAASGLGFPMPWGISADGGTLAVVTASSLDEINVAAVPLSGGTITPLLADPVRIESEPSISANGEWIADLEAPEAGAGGQINIRPFPDVARALYPVGPGQHPVFSPDGGELFYFDGEGIMSVSLQYSPFRIGMPERLFDGRYFYGQYGRSWDVDPNGDRFLMIRLDDSTTAEAEESAESPKIYVVLNWFEELRERVPTD